MGSISDYLEKELLDHCFNAAWASPTTVFLGLSTADPLDTGAGLAEPAAGAYSRVTITFVTAATRNVTQKAKVTFPQATASWGNITHYSIHDAVSGGNFLAHGSLNTGKTVANGNTPSVATSEVVISFTAGEISDYLSHQLLDHAFRNSQYTFISSFAIALATTDILDTDTGSSIDEVTGGNYSRASVYKNGGTAPAWTVAAGLAASLDNGAAITFATPSASWGTVTAIAICDAATSGNILFYENTITEQTPDNGDTVQFAANALKVSMS
jgi:hypothetical protein